MHGPAAGTCEREVSDRAIAQVGTPSSKSSAAASHALHWPCNVKGRSSLDAARVRSRIQATKPFEEFGRLILERG
jgi:hypothetical protein